MLRFLRRFFTMLAIFVGVVLVYMAIAGRDILPPDVSDLLVERVEVAPEENAYTYFCAATNVLVWRKSSGLVKEFSNGSSTNAGPIRELVEANAETINWIRKGVACAAYQSPEPNPESPAGVEIALVFHLLSNILVANAALDRHDGRYEGAADACLLALELGKTVSGRTSSLIEGVVAVVPLRMGVEEISRIARDPAAPAEVLRRLGAALVTIPDPAPALQQSLRAEYAFASKTVDQVARGFVRSDGTPVDTRTRRRMRVLGFFLQPNRTKAIVAGLFREEIANLDRPYRHRTELDYFKAVGFKPGGEMGYLLFHLKPNAAVGARLVGMLCPLAVNEKSCSLDSELAATRLIVALNLHRLDKGAYPATLDALVPDYLEALPNDPYDGEPFRCSPDKGIVYSVGLNLKDDGGSTELREPYRRHATGDESQPRWKANDIVFEFGVQTTAGKKREP
jgi:hypothetical protein